MPMKISDTNSPSPLLWDDMPVARIDSAILDDGVWYARHTLLISSEMGARERELFGFVQFCEDWNERTRRAVGSPPSPSELLRYSSVLSPDRCAIETGDGRRPPISEPPIFLVGGEVTWRP